MPKKKKGGKKEGKKKGKEASGVVNSKDAEEKQFDVPSSTMKELALKQEYVFLLMHTKLAARMRSVVIHGYKYFKAQLLECCYNNYYNVLNIDSNDNPDPSASLQIG